MICLKSGGRANCPPAPSPSSYGPDQSHYIEVVQGGVSTFYIVEQYTIDCKYLAYFFKQNSKKKF